MEGAAALLLWSSRRRGSRGFQRTGRLPRGADGHDELNGHHGELGDGSRRRRDAAVARRCSGDFGRTRREQPAHGKIQTSASAGAHGQEEEKERGKGGGGTLHWPETTKTRRRYRAAPATNLRSLGARLGKGGEGKWRGSPGLLGGGNGRPINALNREQSTGFESPSIRD